MTLAVKFLVAGVSLACASCGGYAIYKNVSGSGKEKTVTKGSEASGGTSSTTTLPTSAPSSSSVPGSK